MKFRKIHIDFQSHDLLLAEELICGIFFDFKLKGVICQVPIQEPDEGFGTNTLPQPEQNAIIGYLPDIDSSDIVIERINKRTRSLLDLGIQTDTQVEVVDEKDWADAWKEYFNVTRITDRIVIKPDWKPYDPGPRDLVIHLDPGMAFGTGTHPTTAMCIGQIQKFICPGNRFLDVGTGSGILMIAAALLGAGPMTGIDTDKVAVDICRDNLAKNKIPQEQYQTHCTTLDKLPPAPGQETYDLVAANIIAQVLVDIMGDLKKHTSEKGIILLSGIIRERMPDIEAALEGNRLKIIHRDTSDEWVTLAVARYPFPG